MNEDHKIILWVFGGCVGLLIVLMNALTPAPDPSRDLATVEKDQLRMNRVFNDVLEDILKRGYATNLTKPAMINNITNPIDQSGWISIAPDDVAEWSRLAPKALLEVSNMVRQIVREEISQVVSNTLSITQIKRDGTNFVTFKLILP